MSSSTSPHKEDGKKEKIKPKEFERFKADIKAGKWKVNFEHTASGHSKLRALVVALDYGQRAPPTYLRGTFTDAYKIITLLKTKFEYTDDDICVLTDIVADGPWPSPERAPLMTKVEEGLRWLCKGSETGDHRFFFFAGHGIRRLEKLDSTGEGHHTYRSYEGVCLSDTTFIAYDKCETCDCKVDESAFARSLTPYDTERRMAHPSTVLWGYRINQILAEHLADGANLTVVFDERYVLNSFEQYSDLFLVSGQCCHSGGTLRGFANSDDQMQNPQARKIGNQSPQRAPPVAPTRRDPYFLEGNFLSLPCHLDLNQSGNDDAITQTRGGENIVSTSYEHVDGDLACLPHIAGELQVQAFNENCRVLCWAACRDVQFAMECGYQGGDFTTVFVNQLTDPKPKPGFERLKMPEGSTYRELNAHIHHFFQQPRKDGFGRLVYQNPQMYSSVNMSTRNAQGLNDFEQRVVI